MKELKRFLSNGNIEETFDVKHYLSFVTDTLFITWNFLCKTRSIITIDRHDKKKHFFDDLFCRLELRKRRNQFSLRIVKVFFGFNNR